MKLTKLFEIPEVFETSDLNLWQDPFISAHLLNAHLNPHHDNASRNHKFIEESSQWILDQITQHQSLLDLGCGPGLYTRIFKDSIQHVTGVDFSTSSITYAKAQKDQVEYIEANYVDMTLNDTYDTITMIHCEIGSVDITNRQAVFSKVKQHLKQDGKFIFDFFTPNALRSFQKSQRWVNHQHGFFSDKPYTEIILNTTYPDYISLKQSIILQDESIKTYRQWYQYLTLTDIQNELEEVGLKVSAFYEDLTGEPLNHTSETIAVVVTHR